VTQLSSPRPLNEITAATFVAEFDDILAAAQPVVVRGLVSDWPLVQAAKSSGAAAIAHFQRYSIARPVTVAVAPPTEKGRLFYRPDMTGLNFKTVAGAFAAFLSDLQTAADDPKAPALAVQSEPISTLLPGFVESHKLPVIPHVQPRIWIGNRIHVAAHYDLQDNIACCAAGRRRFILFPPEQVANLYPGPMELTPAGTPVSMVNFAEPDLAIHPRFALACQAALSAELEPGDAIYIPYLWWHAVTSLDPVNILINYWWDDLPVGVASPYPALFHAMSAFRWLPPAKREQWRSMFDYYVFEKSGCPGSHLPPASRGVLGPATPALFETIRKTLRALFN
jgi:Cupin-like domain